MGAKSKILPTASKDSAFRGPKLFGAITDTRAGYPNHIRRLSAPAVVTESVREFIYDCNAMVQFADSGYQDSSQMVMFRCPLPERGHGLTKNQVLLASIHTHFAGNRSGLKKQNVTHYFNNGRPGTARKPDRTLGGRKKSPAPECCAGKYAI